MKADLCHPTATSSLMYITVPAFNVFKNAANIFTAMGDWYFFGSTLSVGIMASIGLMLVGSLMAGFTDLQFSVVGYTWAGLQRVFLAAYVLSIKYVQRSTQMSEWEQAFYANFLGALGFGAIAAAGGETAAFATNNNIHLPMFWTALTISGFMRAGTVLSIVWLVRITSPTTFAMVNALNSIPSSLLSTLVFRVALSAKNLASVAFGLSSGIVYSYVKYREQQAKAPPQQELEQRKHGQRQ